MQRDTETILGHHREKSSGQQGKQTYPKSRKHPLLLARSGGRVGFEVNAFRAGPLMRNVIRSRSITTSTTMKLLLMLEDDHDRIRRFRAIVARHHPDAVLKIARTAPDFKTEYWSLNDTPDLICLDHDLFTDSPDEPDPGDGRERFCIPDYTVGKMSCINTFNKSPCR